MRLRQLALLVLIVCSAAAPAWSKAEEGKGLLIVAPERFLPALTPYVRHKQTQLSTRTASLEEILRTSPGVDDPERLKQYLYGEWKRHNLGYVLLVGDAN